MLDHGRRGVLVPAGNSQPGATPGAEDDVRKKTTEGPTHISYAAPLGLRRLADILPTACAVGYW